MLDTLLARLQAECTSFAVIAEAPVAAALTTVDAAAASAALKTLLQSAVTEAYAVEAPEGAEPTDSIYRLVSARPVEVDGVRVMSAITFVVTLRATSYAALITALGSVEAQVQASAAAISITDAAMDFDTGKKHFLADLELVYAVPAVAGGVDGNWPALLVDVVDYIGDPEGADLMPIRQRVERTYRLMIMTTGDDLVALRQELEAALLGWQVSAADWPFHFVDGRQVSLPGGIVGWADVYTDAGNIYQPT